MTQDEKWLAKYNEVKTFIEENHRNPSKHNPTERGLYLNWLKHNRQLMNQGGDERGPHCAIQETVRTKRAVQKEESIRLESLEFRV